MLTLTRCPDEIETDCGSAEPSVCGDVKPNLLYDVCTHMPQYNTQGAIRSKCLQIAAQEECELSTECSWNPKCGDNGLSLYQRFKIASASAGGAWKTRCD